MKILRIRRGYTTNSSAYTEWLPPPPGSTQGQQPAAAPPGTTAAPPAAANLQGITVAPPAQPVAAAPAQGPLGGNLMMVTGIVAVVAGAFIAERVIRRMRSGRSVEDDRDE